MCANESTTPNQEEKGAAYMLGFAALSEVVRSFWTRRGHDDCWSAGSTIDYYNLSAPMQI